MRKFITGLTAAALLTALASPADAKPRHHRHHDDVDAGDVVAGAVVIAGIAAIASAIKEDKRRKQDLAVDRCSSEAESRTGEEVAEIFHVGKRKGYYTVEGALDGGGGSGDIFTCTVRRGAVYQFRTRPTKLDLFPGEGRDPDVRSTGSARPSPGNGQALHALAAALIGLHDRPAFRNHPHRRLRKPGHPAHRPPGARGGGL